MENTTKEWLENLTLSLITEYYRSWEQYLRFDKSAKEPSITAAYLLDDTKQRLMPSDFEYYLPRQQYQAVYNALRRLVGKGDLVVGWGENAQGKEVRLYEPAS